ncbi:hypothetical protein [Asticcacaulis solisilvae]|uniref:hypothetical protein n=1 Tax=Asticcacaulis solisilvae TaxID=1217274 RepID=UPI003FD89109
MSSAPISTLFTLPEGWRLAREDAQAALYGNAAGDILSINFFDMMPDIDAALDDVDGLRRTYRRATIENDLALIETETAQVDGLPAVRTLFKGRMDPRGFVFMGAYTLPFAASSYVVRVQSEERGTTGMRETMVFMMAGLRDSDPVTRKIIGWEQDPYEPGRTDAFMRNLADDAKHDAMIPDHPLTKVRTYLAEIEASMRVAPIVRALPPFHYP